MWRTTSESHSEESECCLDDGKINIERNAWKGKQIQIPFIDLIMLNKNFWLFSQNCNYSKELITTIIRAISIYSKRGEKKTSRALNVNKDESGREKKSIYFITKVTCEALVVQMNWRSWGVSPFETGSPVRFEHLLLEAVLLFSVCFLKQAVVHCFYSMWMDKVLEQKCLFSCIWGIQLALAPVQKVLVIYL